MLAIGADRMESAMDAQLDGLQSGSAAGNRQPPATAKGLRAHFEQGRRLSAFELGPFQQLFNAGDEFRVMAGGDQVLTVASFLDQILE
jgi:hypothetical protein